MKPIKKKVNNKRAFWQYLIVIKRRYSSPKEFASFGSEKYNEKKFFEKNWRKRVFIFRMILFNRLIEFFNFLKIIEKKFQDVWTFFERVKFLFMSEREDFRGKKPIYEKTTVFVDKKPCLLLLKNNNVPVKTKMTLQKWLKVGFETATCGLPNSGDDRHM